MHVAMLLYTHAQRAAVTLYILLSVRLSLFSLLLLWLNVIFIHDRNNNVYTYLLPSWCSLYDNL